MPYLPSPIPLHDIFTIAHHSVVDPIAVVLNAVLLLAIVLKSPQNIRSYSVLLVNAVVIDFIAALTSFLTMVRLMPVQHVLAYIYAGPCANVSGQFCHCLYTIMLSTFSQSEFLIAASFGYRYYVLGRPTPSVRTMLWVCLLISIPNLIILTTFSFTLDDETDVRAQLRIVRPSYELDEYLVTGHASIFKPLTMFTIGAVTMPIGPTMIAIFIVRNMVLNKLSAASSKMSGRTVQMHSALTRVLTFQAILPVFISFAVGSYGLCQLDVMCSPTQEQFIMESVSFIPLAAPIITLSCVGPYRQFATKLARFEFDPRSPSVVSTMEISVARSKASSFH